MPSWSQAARAFARAYGLGSAKAYGPMAWLLALGTVVSYLGRGAAVPFVVVYLTREAGLPLAAIGLGIAIEQLTRAFTSPLFGSLSDRFGRKPFMVGGVVLQAATFPAYLLVDGVPSYLAVSVLAGLGQAPYQPALSAYLADTTAKEHRVGVFGLVQMTKNLGWALGVLLGGLLVTRSFPLLFVIGGALPLVYAALLFFFLKEPTHAEGEPRGRFSALAWLRVLRAPRFAAFVALAVVIFLTWGQLNTVLPVFVGQGLLLDETWVTRVFAVNSALIVLLQVPVSARAERCSRTRGLALAGAMNAAGFLLLGLSLKLAMTDLAYGKAALLGATVVLTLAEMLDTPLTYTLATELAPPGARGGAMGVLSLAAPIGMGAAPVLADILSKSGGWSWVWVTYAGIVLVGAFGFLLFGTATRNDEDPAANKLLG